MSPHAELLLLNEIKPRLAGTIPHCVNRIGAEDAEELIQDAIALAARMLHYAESNGKKLSPGNIAYYTILHSKSGRRSVGHSCSDVYGSATQLTGRAKLESFDYEVGFAEDTGDGLPLLDVFADHNAEDPSIAAARNLDWAEFMNRQDDRGQTIVQCLNEGRCWQETAQACKLSISAIQQRRQKMAADIVEFMGSDILQRVNDRPRWTDNIHADRELVACKEERKW